MQELDDSGLLQEYVLRGSEEAFAALVGRHINKVYSVALRHLENPHRAEEVTQAVFVILARKSRTLLKHTSLSGWLFQTARLTSLTLLRSEIRRARREEEAHMQTIVDQTEAEAWRQIAPLLDNAIAGLGAQDREAIVLRFFDDKSMKEVGMALNSSEDAAKQLVNRALEKLRVYFVRRGIASPTALIASAISAHSVQTAPPGLAGTVCAAAAKGSALAGSTSTLAKGVLKLMVWTKVKMASVLGVSVVLGALAIERDNLPRVFGPTWNATPPQLWYDDFQAPVFSSDRAHAAFAARKGEKWYVLVDGREEGEYDSDIQSLSLSSDGRHVACMIQTGEKWRVVTDGKEGAPYDTEPRSLVLSPNGKHAAYVVGQGEQWRTVRDGREGASYDEIPRPIFGPDSKRPAILIMDEMGAPGEGTRPTRGRFCVGCRPGALTRRRVTGP